MALLPVHEVQDYQLKWVRTSDFSPLRWNHYKQDINHQPIKTFCVFEISNLKRIVIGGYKIDETLVHAKKVVSDGRPRLPMCFRSF